MRIAGAFLVMLLSLATQAAPLPPASLDRRVWPEALNSPALFDVASRAEILSFAQVLHESELLDDAALAKRLGLRQINLQKIRAVRARMWQRVFQGYQQAQRSCEQDASFCYPVDSMADLRAQAATFAGDVGTFYTGWIEPSHQFHVLYLDEQLRKAALLPQTTSEVERLSSRERNGDELNDRMFLLTFVGGPGPEEGSTDALSRYLRRQKMQGTFFVLGNRLQQRRDGGKANALAELYRGQCVGIQGWEYRSHAQWQDWQDSLKRSQARVQADLPEQYVPLFRPPYGQRRADGEAFMARQQLQVSLWDIDAQDASALSAEASAQRVLTLMLLWRKGVIQLHDSLPKAQPVVEWLLHNTAQSGIGWEGCRDYGYRETGV
ncbi:polysaccharide deacetylase family protein [Pseudomonas sp. SWI6]|uniref:Polysaccharide deacetylase family protein n=1 Tax=Pseudomonas taiwanensis TaxID=470150 RepID=A0ABR6VAR4_9PSED|nr:MULTISPECIES: polysaccharide deacetylase family protein [Pseudomonas]AVD85601.1 polysaccharide deacetylase family protein [Pseudomonas sp. SWI6]AVD90760.1 polysaccharide deacetylase family protein [Pseudomonas sp. SWI44]MBC3477604.1 polysaccharide deacetylase family protein [Pseudomonas taiwanensis]MBC3491052.1 polysaccharide deacetylase family protein [Pseudomonas taiwanensis]MDT8925826.1 polysaccharide deacetylase family protein [Pseudomonas taiwanensis]